MIFEIKKKKTLQYHYISDKSEHGCTFEQIKSELRNQSKLQKLTPEIRRNSASIIIEKWAKFAYHMISRSLTFLIW